MCKKSFNWGIIGCGQIAGQFARSLEVISDATLYAVASRSEEKTRKFCAKHHGRKWYGSYEGLAADPEVDAVYNAWVYGAEGSIHMPEFFHARTLHVARYDGYSYAVLEVKNCVRAGILESPVMLLEESLQIVQIMDTIRRQWGLTNPAESK